MLSVAEKLKTKIFSNFNLWCNRVEFEEHLDGGGRLLAESFAKVVPQTNNVLEMGCGPAWIGFWLKEKNLCSNLYLSDINPTAIAIAKKTDKQLNTNATFFISDLFDDIDSTIKFDCIVTNPPNYVNIQKDHPLGFLRDDLRPSDLDWKFHKKFYSQVKSRLAKGGKIFISEVGLNKKEIIADGKVYDKRDREPFFDFWEMLTDNGLEIVGKHSVYTGDAYTDSLVEILEIKVKNDH